MEIRWRILLPFTQATPRNMCAVTEGNFARMPESQRRKFATSCGVEWPEAGADICERKWESKGIHWMCVFYSQFPQFTGHCPASWKENKEVSITINSIDQLKVIACFCLQDQTCVPYDDFSLPPKPECNTQKSFATWTEEDVSASSLVCVYFAEFVLQMQKRKWASLCNAPW